MSDSALQRTPQRPRNQAQAALPFRLLLLIVLGVQAAWATADFSVALTDSKGRPVANAVVTLTPLDAPPPPLTLSQPAASITQKDGEFSPYVTVVAKGSRVEFPNRDTVQHHVYSLSPSKRFEIPLSGGEVTYGEVFDKAGVVTLGCNIHDWMLAYLVVVETPWFQLVDLNGKATLRGLPDGRYRLDIWHPQLAKTHSEELMLNEGNTQRSIMLSLKPDRRIKRALEGSQDGYR